MLDIYKKKHLKDTTKSNENFPGKNSIKRILQHNLNICGTKIDNLYHFNYRTLKVAYEITIGNHQTNHANSIITTVSKINDVGVDKVHISKIKEEMADKYAKLINQFIFSYQLTFLALLKKYHEDGKIIIQIELPITLGITQNLTQSEINNINFQWPSENKIQNIETQESGWNFLRINSMKTIFYKTTDINASSYVKTPLRSSALLNKKMMINFVLFGQS